MAAQSRLAVAQSIDWNAILRLPREDAIALAYSAEYDQFRPGILSIVFRIWASTDPIGAHNRLTTLPRDAAVDGIEMQVIKNWMAQDPRAALTAAVESPNTQAFPMAMNEYAHLDPEKALSIAQEYGSTLGEAEWSGIVRGVADTRPDLAAEHVASLGNDGEYLLGEFIDHLILRDPAGAFDWLLTHFPNNTDHVDAIATAFFVRDPEHAFVYLTQMREGTTKRKFTKSLCQAKAVNEESRAASRLPQPQPGYADGVCPRRFSR